MNPCVSVIIVNYNCAGYLSNCIESIYNKTEDISFEIIVVDNNSSDDSLFDIRQKFHKVIIIENSSNLGFGAANNIGSKYAKGEYLLLLNPDTILINNAIKIFYDHAVRLGNKMGCIGGNLLGEDLKPANIGGNFPSLFQLFSDIGFRCFYLGYYKKNVSLLITINTLGVDHRIDCICGADLFINRTLFYNMNGFDEDYFLYFEDTDLCYRIVNKGFHNYIVPEATILHLESASIIDNKADKINFRKFSFFEKGKQLFFSKSYGRHTLIFVKALTIFYILSRLIAHRGSIKQYLKMIIISLKMNKQTNSN